MDQILDSLSPENSSCILCHYINATSILQIARITNIPNWYFERIVFPGQRLLFEAPQMAELEIHTDSIPSAILSNKIPCAKNLQVYSGKGYGRCTDSGYSNGGKECFVQSNH